MSISNIKKIFYQYRDRIVFVLPILAILAVFQGSVFQDTIFNNGDILFNMFNYLQYHATGGSVVTQYILSGFPVMSSVAGVWFYPVYDLFSVLFGVFRAYGILNVLNLFLTYFFTYLYAQRIGISKMSSVLTGTVFVFSGQLMLWSESLLNTNYYYLLPASLLFTELFRVHVGLKRYLHSVILGFILGVGWLSGHVQFVVYIHLCVVMYWVVVSLPVKKIVVFVRDSIALVVAYTVSFVVGYPQIFAILDYREVSVRANGVRLLDYWVGALLPQDLIHYILPFFHIPFIPFASPNLYLGLIPLFLLVYGVVNFRKIGGKFFLFYGVLFLGCLFASFKYSPFGILLHYLPLLDSFREAPRIMFLGNFGAAIVVGFSLDYLSMERKTASRAIARTLMWLKRIFLYVFIPLSFVFAILQFFFSARIISILSTFFLDHLYKNTSGLPKEHYLSIIATSVSESFAQVSVISWQVFVCIIFAILSFMLLKRMQLMKAEDFILSVTLLTVINLLFVYGGRSVYVSHAVHDKIPQSVLYLSLIHI